MACVQLELEHFLTLHLRSRKFPSTAAYKETVRVLGHLADQIRTGNVSRVTDQVLMLAYPRSTERRHPERADL